MNSEFLRWLRLRWRGLFQRGRQEAALDREMRFHVEMLVAENIAAGMAPEEARLAAQREFGGGAQYREECRDTWRPAVLSGLLSDFAFAARSLRRSPGFTAVAAFTLALGIGVNGVMFSFVRDAVLRPFLRDRELNLVALYNGRDGADPQFRFFSHGEFKAAQASTEVFHDVAAIGVRTVAIGPERNLQRRMIGLVSENYFSLLGVRPALGRFFTAEEARPGAAIPVLVATHALWERLGRPANFVGSTLRVESRSYTVIGVAPRSFVGLNITIGPDAWLPLGEAGNVAGWNLERANLAPLNLFARLRPELSLETAKRRMESAGRRLNALPPFDTSGPRRFVLDAPPRSDFGNVAPADDTFLPLFAGLALGLALTVLIVACLNLANMLLARGVARRKEIAIRLALGASRWRVIRGLVAEGVVLAWLGGGLSLALGQWSYEALFLWSNEAFAAGKFAMSVQPFFDGPIVLATLAFSGLAAVAFSLWPALRVTRPDLFPDLKQISGEPPVSRRWSRLFAIGDLPLLAQIALSLTLLFSAALFVRSARNAGTLELGFQPAQQLVAQLDYKLTQLDRDEIRRRQEALLTSSATLPGVTTAVLASNVPYNFDLPLRGIRVFDGDAAPTPNDPARGRFGAGYTAVTRGYFAAMGIALIRGRDFTSEESAGTGGQPVAIIDELLARALFGEADALGRHVVLDSSSASPALEIVGIVRRSRNAVFGNVPRRVYRPLGQSPEANVYLQLRVPQPAALVETLRAHLAATEPAVPVLLVRPLADFVGKNINVLLVQLTAVIFGVFGGIALVLAVVGVYGVKAHAVARRTREIGVRVALGARPRDVMTLILKQGAWQAGVGVAGGLVLALIAGRGLSAMLYRVNPADPLALGVSAVLLAIAVLLACWLPARRAMKVDPLVAIRTE